jgi:hypothetical protein
LQGKKKAMSSVGSNYLDYFSFKKILMYFLDKKSLRLENNSAEIIALKENHV